MRFEYILTHNTRGTYNASILCVETTHNFLKVILLKDVFVSVFILTHKTCNAYKYVPYKINLYVNQNKYGQLVGNNT